MVPKIVYYEQKAVASFGTSLFIINMILKGSQVTNYAIISFENNLFNMILNVLDSATTNRQDFKTILST